MNSPIKYGGKRNCFLLKTLLDHSESEEGHGCYGNQGSCYGNQHPRGNTHNCVNCSTLLKLRLILIAEAEALRPNPPCLNIWNVGVVEVEIVVAQGTNM